MGNVTFINGCGSPQTVTYNGNGTPIPLLIPTGTSIQPATIPFPSIQDASGRQILVFAPFAPTITFTSTTAGCLLGTSDRPFTLTNQCSSAQDFFISEVTPTHAPRGLTVLTLGPGQSTTTFFHPDSLLQVNAGASSVEVNLSDPADVGAITRPNGAGGCVVSLLPTGVGAITIRNQCRRAVFTDRDAFGVSLGQSTITVPTGISTYAPAPGTVSISVCVAGRCVTARARGTVTLTDNTSFCAPTLDPVCPVRC